MAVTVSDLFKDYESDFKKLQEDIERELESCADGSCDDVARTLKEVGRKASQADQALRQMDLEAKVLPTSQRSALEPTLRQHRAKLCEQRRVLAEQQQTADRSALLGAGAAVYGRRQEREQTDGARQKMQQATSKLDQASMQALEAEQIAAEVSSDLRNQRESIVRSSSNIREIGANYSMAKAVLERMRRLAEGKRLATYAVALFMLLVLAVAAYAMLGGGSAAKPPAAGSASPAPALPGGAATNR